MSDIRAYSIWATGIANDGDRAHPPGVITWHPGGNTMRKYAVLDGKVVASVEHNPPALPPNSAKPWFCKALKTGANKAEATLTDALIWCEKEIGAEPKGPAP